ncbi:mesoderm induction early response protein 1 isoform X2 [Ixodes scapularis]|uniref:mesoderm induction early response protein 1 isoform X2 n=1 Tax=Ixodes scapularis TaxID=6945 RepID=UPI001AD6F1A5|nr:mesoderm induction early response protein 1 isoform X2 [Ixodes scapularis]
MAEPNPGDPSADSDQDFDPSAEMLVDEYDDEKTLDEEEALESDASDDELNTLQKEGEMPLEDLLAMFGYKDGEKAVDADSESEEDDEEEEEEEEEENEGEAEKVAPRVETVPPAKVVVAPPAPPPPVKEAEPKAATATKTPPPVVSRTPPPPAPTAPPPPRREHRTTSTAHLLRSVSHASESSNSDSDEDFTIEEYWKKNENFNDVNLLGPAYARVPHQTIQVGSEYQATIPVGLCKYDDAPAYENEDRLLWDPAKISDTDGRGSFGGAVEVLHGSTWSNLALFVVICLLFSDGVRTFFSVEDYLSTAQEPTGNAVGYGSLPVGCHTRDDEQALYLLLQCGHNVEEALRRRRMNPALPSGACLDEPPLQQSPRVARRPVPGGGDPEAVHGRGRVSGAGSPEAQVLERAPLCPSPEMSLWSEEECRSFESGLRLYGKDFHLIQLHKVRTRSVAELVHFYYLWKKTERHDIFASKVRLEKKKYALHPGTTDYMDRFLDEQENSQQQQLQQQQQQHHHQDGERSCSPSEPKRPRLAGPLQLTSHLARHENGRDPTSAVSANPAAFPRENGRGDRLWTGPESSSDEDDLPLIATARPPLAKTAPASPAVSNKATSSGTLVASAHTTAPAAPQPATPDE